MHYTVINLTRFGDLLQTACTISALKKSGDHTISLICLSQFADAASFIPHLDHVGAFSGAKLLKNLSLNTFPNWAEAYQDLMLWIEKYFNEFQPNCIINLTPTVKTRLLTKLLSQQGTKHINTPIQEIGFCVNEYGFNFNTNIWTSYTQAVAQYRGGSPYNLIDEFRSMLNLAPEEYHLKKPTASVIHKAQKILSERTKKHKEVQGVIGFQLGASNTIRQWNIQNFAELAKLLWKKKRFIPILLGTKQEQTLAEEFSHHAVSPFINYCGQSTLQELGAMLSLLKALISNDTGTLHLAIGLGIPVVGIYLATAQVWDTGPYGANQICLEPAMDCHPCNFNTNCSKQFTCKKSISAETVYQALCLRLGDKKANPTKSDDARVWKGFFQDDGFINYTPLHKDTSLRTVWMQCQRLFYKNLLTHIQTKKQVLYSEQSFQPNILDLTLLDPALLEMKKLQAFLLLTREQAALFNRFPVQKNQEKFLVSTQRLTTFLKQSRFFIPLSLLFEQLLQDSAQNMESIIQFFDILKNELNQFSDFLTSQS